MDLRRIAAERELPREVHVEKLAIDAIAQAVGKGALHCATILPSTVGATVPRAAT
ncbi:MAG: hypothetical protein L6R19_12990 [Alphaproteobacteria bacterium]|nr:hypothetical protein [Alphaproteobacteria bacterium]